MEGIFIREKGRGGRDQPPDRSSRREERERERQTDRERWEHSECAQEVLLVAAAEDISCQNPKNRPVQIDA